MALFRATLIACIFFIAIRDSYTLDCPISEQSIETGNILPETGHLNASGVSVPKNHYEYYNATHFRSCSCAATSCVRKCCPLGQSYGNNSPPQCIDNNNTASIDIPIYDEKYRFLHNEVEKTAKLYHGKPCPLMYRLLPRHKPKDDFKLLSNGELYLPNDGRARKGLDHYCIDAMLGRNGTVVLVCPSEKHDIPAAIEVGTLISIPFFLLTLAVYCYLPELRNTHGKSLMCHVASLTVGFVFLSAANLSGKHPNRVFCSLAGPVIQFSFLATFFWLNVMCFDIWLAFRAYKGTVGNTRDTERKKFLSYSAYAWGGSAIILIVTLIIEWSPLVPDHVVKPRFGTKSCFLHDKFQKLYYFDGLLAILLTINLCLFVATLYKILRVSKETSVLQSADSRKSNEHNKRKFFLYVKLFLVMGVSWTLEVISWAVEGPYYIWLISDICNSLQGLFIFVIFVCKARTRRLLMAKWKKQERPSTDTSSTSYRSCRRDEGRSRK